jgi:hypothetical protein
MNKNCPKCGKPCGRDEVDIGIGTQYGPWFCLYCDWSEAADLEATLIPDNDGPITPAS